MSTKRTLTVKEAANELGCSPTWLYVEVQAERIPYQRFGRRIKFTEAHVEWIRQHTEHLPQPELAKVPGLSARSAARHQRRRAS